MTLFSSNGGRITLRANPLLATAEGRSADLVQPLLPVERHEFDERARCRTTTREPFIREKDCLYFATGLVPHVERELSRRGHEVAVVRLDAVSTQAGCELLMRRMLQSENGLILSAAAGGRLRLRLPARSEAEWENRIVRLAAAEKDKSILFVAKNRSDVRRLRKLLEASGRGRVAHLRDAPTGPPPWTTVVTSFHFGRCGLDRYQMVVFADLESALLKSSLEQLSHWGDMFHCITLDSGGRHCPREQRWIAALLGPLEKHPAEESSPAAVLVPSPPAPPPGRAAHCNGSGSGSGTMLSGTC